MRILEPLEHETQAAFVEWLGYAKTQYPETEMFFAVPNGGHRDPRVAAKLVAEGVRPGVPDMCLPVPRRGFGGLWLEFKRRGTGRHSEAQLWWLERLAYYGHCTVTVWTAQQAIDVTAAYLNGALKSAELQCPIDMATTRLAA